MIAKIKITGQDRYNVEFLDETNVGRLVTIKYKGGEKLCNAF